MFFETQRTLSTQSFFPYRRMLLEEPKGFSQSAAPCFYGVAFSVQCLRHLMKSLLCDKKLCVLRVLCVEKKNRRAQRNLNYTYYL